MNAKQWLTFLKRSLKKNKGQGMVEYGLIISLVALVAMAGLNAIAGGLNGVFNQIAGALG